MTEKEKVINELTEYVEATLAVDSEYVNLPLDVVQYALHMLGDQEAVIPYIGHGENGPGLIRLRCGACHEPIAREDAYCRHCGRAIQ